MYSGFPNGDPLPGSVFPRIQLIWCLVIVSLCMCIYTQDFQLRVHPGPLHLLLCAYRGSRSVRVQVAHGREWWPGSRLAAPVSIWCWQFTQAFFSTTPGRINTQFPFSEGCISQPLWLEMQKPTVCRTWLNIVCSQTLSGAVSRINSYSLLTLWASQNLKLQLALDGNTKIPSLFSPLFTASRKKRLPLAFC